MSREIPLHISPTVEAGVHFFAKASLAATVLVSGYATYEQHNDGDHTWSVEIPGETHVVSSETVVTPTGGKNKIEQRPVEVAGTEETEVGEEYGMGESPYAREYADDAAAEFVDAGAIEQLNRTITNMEQEGWSDFRINVIGRASGEDDMSRPDAGLITPSFSDRNIELARTRAFSFVDEMQKDEKLAAIPVENATGVEEDLTPEELEAFDAMRSQFGYGSVSEMVEAWNNNSKDVPPTVDSTLSAVLGNSRGVLVTIRASRPVAGEAGDVEEQAVCVVPVRESITNYVEYEPWHAPVPKLVVIPIPVVLPYRRRKSNAAPTVDIDSFAALHSRYEASKGTGVVAGKKAVATPAEPPVELAPRERKPRDWKKGLVIGSVIIGGVAFVAGAGYCVAQIELPKSFVSGDDPCTDDMPRENNVVRTSERDIPADNS